MSLYDEQAALEAAIAASLADAAACKAPSAPTSKNHIPKLAPTPQAPPVFSTERYGWKEGAGYVRQVQTIDQWGREFADIVEAHKAPSAICGYVVAATVKVLCSKFPHAVMTVGEVEDMVKVLSSVEVMKPLIASEMERLCVERQAYTESHEEEFASQKAKARYLKDWVANYELSDVVKATGNPAVHFLRHCERDDDIEHEEKRRVEQEAPFRDLVVFVEQGVAERRSLLHRPSQWVKSNRVKETEVAASSGASGAGGGEGGGDSGSGKEEEGESKGGAPRPSSFPCLSFDSPCPAFITDCLGHFTVCRPVALKTDGGLTPTLIMFNSMGGDYTRNVAVTALYRMVFQGLDECTDPLFLHATHVSS